MAHTQSGTVGPIIFGDKTARKQLLEYDEVVTFRKRSRTTGDTWWRESRLGPKQGDVVVEEIGKINPRERETLEKFQDLSGFENVAAWQAAIKELNGSLPASGYLYRVQRRNKPLEE